MSTHPTSRPASRDVIETPPAEVIERYSAHQLTGNDQSGRVAAPSWLAKKIAGKP